MLLLGLHECDRGRRIDALAGDLLHNWTRLSAEERCTTLGVIAGLLAADVGAAIRRPDGTSSPGGRPS